MRLYYHSPCLDGVASAVLACRHFGGSWTPEKLEPISYSVKQSWLDFPEGEFAVVDFLFHPQAVLWVDHHMTTFVSAEVRRQFETRQEGEVLWVYDPSAPSCASLMHRIPELVDDDKRDAELVAAATKTDSAAYETPEEAVFGPGPALRMNRALSEDPSPVFSRRLIIALLSSTVSEVASEPWVDELCRAHEAKVERGIGEYISSRWRDRRHPEIARFDVNLLPGTTFNRYTPYLKDQDAAYSVGIMRSSSGAKVTAMRNPWREFESAPIGTICQKFGGGGHQRVGSILVPSGRDAISIADAVAAIIAEFEEQ